MRSLQLCLVGSEQQENLGLGYLAAAVERAGHQVHVVALETRRDVPSAVAAVLAARADVVGVSIAFQHAVEDSIAFIDALRAAGFAGHLTCGGHVPSFCYEPLLREVASLDSVVRFEGEATLVELLARLTTGTHLDSVAGLVVRASGEAREHALRSLPLDLEALPRPKRRAEPFLIGGVPMAFVLTARGCPGDCSYCCLTSFTRAAGGPAVRLRQPEHVADEIAALRAERDVRVIVVQDDLFILPSEATSIARMDAIGDELRRRGVDDLLFWIKGRPDDVTGPVLAAARRMGAIHLFLGVEHAVGERLRYLGRTHTPEDNRRALELCREHGLRASFNVMLFDPDCRLDDVSQTIEFAGDHIDATWNLCRTEIYSGTRLRDRLAAEGRLDGSYRGYDYRMRDERAELAFRVLRTCLHERCFACDSVVNRVISLSFARQVHQALLPGSSADALAAHVERLCEDVYGETVALLRRVRDFAAGAALHDVEAIHERTAELALEVLARDGALGARAADLWQRLTARGRALRQREA